MKNMCLAVLAAVFTVSCLAGDFDYKFKFYVGDINNDAMNDIYVTREREIILLHGDIVTPIVLSPPIEDFILLQNQSQSFTIQSNLSISQQEQVKSWPQREFIPFPRDVNHDGSVDLELRGVSNVISGVHDQILFSVPDSDSAPYKVTSIEQKYLSYFRDVMGWLLNPNYFEENAPLGVVGSEPPTRQYYGSIFNFTSTGPVSWINNFVQRCDIENFPYDCGITYEDPEVCWRYMDLYDEDGVYIGSDWVNVCIEADIHIFVYEPGTVVLEPDYSVYDEDAVETTEVMDRINSDCGGVVGQGDLNILNSAINSVLGSGWNVFNGGSINVPNSALHPPFPGDSLFDPNDPTFHHYDALTRICNHGEIGCDKELLSNEVIRYFSYPSQGLKPSWTFLNGVLIDVYLAPPPLVTVPSAYQLWFGEITQRQITQTPWTGGIQNITDANHFVFPGTINRVVQSLPDGLYVFTHGMGENRLFCQSPHNPRPYHVIMGYSNDFFGPKVFRTLDKEMKEFWEENYN